MDDWDADPAPAAATNDDEDWGTAAAAVPLPADDNNFGAPSPLKKTNTVVTVAEVAPTPVASGDDEDWGMGGVSAPAPVPAASGDDDEDWDAAIPTAQAATADGDGFGGGGDGGAFGAPAPVTAVHDPFGGGGGDAGAFGAATATGDGLSDMAPPPVVKKKWVIEKHLMPPERSKAFTDFFVPQHSEQYEVPEPDAREMPLRRNETHNLYSKELAISVAAGAEKPQQDTEKKTKKKSAIHYNGNRVTSSHVWTDYQVRLLLGLINGNIHHTGKVGDIDRLNKRTMIERRRALNASLPKATDGHTHTGQWAYHDVADLLNNDVDRSNIPVVDVRDMIHRLVDERKAGQNVAHRIRAPRLTHRVVVAWKRKQDFTGDRKEWIGDKDKEGRRDILARQKKDADKDAQEVVYNPGRIVPASGANADAVGVRSGWVENGAEDDAFGGDAQPVPEVIASVEGCDFGGFGGPAAVAAPVVVAEWDEDEDEGNVAPATVLPSVETDEWGAEEDAIATLVSAHNEATPAPAKAPAPEPAKVAEPLGAFGLADPFSAPLPGNAGLKDVAPAAPAPAPAPIAVVEWDEEDEVPAPAPAPPATAAQLDEWDEDDSPPAAIQPDNTDTVMADAPHTASDVAQPATGANAGDDWDDDDDAATPAAPFIPAMTSSDIPRSDTQGSLNTAMGSTNLTSPTTTTHHSSRFTAVNAPPRSAPTSAPTSAPAQAYTIDAATGFNPERLALLTANADREDTPPEREKRDPWAQNLDRAVGKGVSGFNAMPLAFNRLTGERADPGVVAAAKAKASADAKAAGGSRTPLGASKGNNTPLPAGWGDSPKDTEMGWGDDWGAESPTPGAAKPTDKDGDVGAVDEGEGTEENKPKEKKYVDLDAGWDAAGADDVELDY